MIKTALKHWIFEHCIHMFFNNVEKNFKIVTSDKFKVGGIYHKIILEFSECNTAGMIKSIYYDCKIYEVNKYTFKFRSSHCDDYYIDGSIDTGIPLKAKIPMTEHISDVSHIEI